MHVIVYLAGQLQLEDDLIASRSELAKVQSSLSKEQDKVTLLHHQVDDLVSKHAEDITVRDDFIKRLNVELDSKANLIVLLTQQIYRIRAKLKQELEYKSTKALVCSCPHCYVHSKISESNEAHSALCSLEKKLAPLRKADHRHHSHQSPPSLHSTDSLPTTSPVVSGTPARHLTPTPPPSSPPTSASGWRHGIVKRASTPMRRSLSSPTDFKNIPSHTLVQEDHTYHIHKRHTRQRQRIRDEGGGSISSGRTSSQEELQQLLSLKDFEGEDRVIRTKSIIRRDGPAILPPIVTSPVPNAEQLEDTDSVASGSGMLSHVHCQDLDMVADSPFLQHRHMASYVAKSPGLSSAPPSSFRVLHRAGRSRGQGQGSRGVVSEEEPDCREAEGTLLVKENERKVSSSAARWAKGTPALD